MVTAEEPHTSQQLSAWNSSNLDQTALLQLGQNYSLPYFPPVFTGSAAFPWQHAPDSRCFKAGHQNAGDRFANLQPPYMDISCCTGNQHHIDSQFAQPRGIALSENKPVASSAPQKRFLIFDQSGNQTRLFYSPSFSPRNHNFPSSIPTNDNGLSEKVTALVDQPFLVKPPTEEKWDENHLTDGEEGEMLEDSEEINALLYSDSDDEYDDDDDDDEVNSTGHTPFGIEEGYKKDKFLEEVMEEVASSDGSPKQKRLLDGSYKKPSLTSMESPPKQKRLLDGSYKKPSLTSMESPPKHGSSCSCEDDEALSCAAPMNFFYDDIHSIKRHKKVKIREALKTLESVIPGLNSNDPVSAISEAVTYLEAMKVEAEALGLNLKPLSLKTASFP